MIFIHVWAILEAYESSLWDIKWEVELESKVTHLRTPPSPAHPQDMLFAVSGYNLTYFCILNNILLSLFPIFDFSLWVSGENLTRKVRIGQTIKKDDVITPQGGAGVIISEMWASFDFIGDKNPFPIKGLRLMSFSICL